MKIIHEITLDVSRQGVQAVIPLAQHSAGVHRLIFTLRNGSVPIAFGDRDGATMFVEGDIIEGCTLYTDNGAYPNSIICDISAGVTSKAAQRRAVLQLYKADEAFTYSPEIMFNISKDITSSSKVQESPQYGAVVKAAFAAEQYALLAQQNAEKAKEVVLKVRINAETNTWERSYDNGATWEDLGVQATGSSHFTSAQRCLWRALTSRRSTTRTSVRLRWRIPPAHATTCACCVWSSATPTSRQARKHLRTRSTNASRPITWMRAAKWRI